MKPMNYEDADFSILCVEDDPDARNFLCEIIKSGFPRITLHSAEDGLRGLAMYKEHAPHLTITDVCMPLMDGIRMAKEIRAVEPDARILVLTAHIDTGYLLDAIRIGISNYLLKPVNPELLCKAIDDIISKLILDRRAREGCAQISNLHRTAEECNAVIKPGSEQGNAGNVEPAFDPLAGYNPEEEPGQSLRRENAVPVGNRDFAAYCYRLAHDLRSPLNGINITSEALIMLFGDQLNDECKTFIGYIQEEVQRMNKMIDGVMTSPRHIRQP